MLMIMGYLDPLLRGLVVLALFRFNSLLLGIYNILRKHYFF